MASMTRESPSRRFNSTPAMAVIAATVTSQPTPGTADLRATTSSGAAAVRAASARPGAPTAPTATAATATYSTIVTTSVMMIARGMLLRGSRTSSPSVAMRPYPV